MVENLKFATEDGLGSWLYENKAKSCELFGRLYSWSTSMNVNKNYLDEKSDPSKQEKVSVQ